MAQGNQALSKKLEDKGGKVTALSFQKSLEDWQKNHASRLIQMIGGDQEKANKLFVVCMGVISRNTQILECTFTSICACIMQSFQLDLFPGAFGECAYVPLRNGQTKQTECNFWPMYQGLTKLMRNAGNRMVVARVVYDGDFFEYHEGERAPEYVPAVILGKKRGARLFTYAAVSTREGMWQVEVMSPEQVEVIRSRSKRGDKEPWASRYEDDVNAMWSKTVLKRLSKWCTKSAELISAVELDNEIDGDETIKKSARIIDMGLPGDTPLGEAEKAIEALGTQKALDAPKEGVVIPASPMGLEGAELDRKLAEENSREKIA